MKNALLPNRLRYWLLPILALVLLVNYVSQARLRFDDPTVRPGLKSASERPKETALKSKTRRVRSQQAPASNDPIRFTLQADKRQVAVGEDIELTITAQLMSLSPNLMFFLPGSNAYTLKLLTPAGFQVTGGDFAEYVTGELTYPANTQATYHLRGHFTSPTEGLSFRLLRSHGQANSQSLYEEKARLQIVVQAQADGAARLSDACAGISLSAQASPATVGVGGSVNLSATCTGCGSGGGSTLYSTNFDGQVPNSSFQSDYTDQVIVVSNAQQDNGAYCPVTTHTGSGGSLLLFRGESTGRVWAKDLSVLNGTTYTFSVWVKPVYNGNPASGATQQTLKLKVNGTDIANSVIAASNAGCGSGWVQLSGSWTANTTGSVPFSIQIPNTTSWQHAFVLDDLEISGGGGGSGANYAWTALQGGSAIATANSASTQVTVPTTAGSYQYRVTLTSGSCTTSQDVTVTVTGGTNPCAGISLSAQASPATVGAGGSVNLSATCIGCGGGGGGSTLYSTNFDGQVPNTDFQTDMGDAVRVLSNAQNISDTHFCSVGDHSGNGGKLVRFDGENPGRIWEKSLNVVAGTTYAFSVWVRPIYNGTPASGSNPQTIQLKVNGGVQGSPTIAASNPGCGSGWVQLSGSWTANTTGSVPFSIQMPTATSWQKAFVLDDIQISSSGGSSGASYSWQALQGGSAIASANSASTQVTVPSTAGNYQYRVTLTSGSCTTSQDVTVTVTGAATGEFNYPIPTSQSAWTSNTDILSGRQIGEVFKDESEFVKLEVRKNYGGAIQLTDKATGFKCFDFNDWGRESEITVYSGPGNFSSPAGGTWYNIGWNPITVGDDGKHGSPVEYMGKVLANDGKEYIYVKTQLLNWPDGNSTTSRLLECTNERWIRLNGKEVDVKARIKFNRTDQTFYAARQQEYPCFMVPGWNTKSWYYTGNSPYTNAPATSTNTLESYNGATGQGVAFQQTSFNVSEPWSAVEYQPGRFIFNNTDKLGAIATTVYVPNQDSNSNDEGANATTYSTPTNFLTVDPNGTWYHNYGFYVTGDLTEGRNWANSRPRKYGDVPDFRFDVAHGRNDWYVLEGTDQREPFASDGWHANFVPSRDGNDPDASHNTARRSKLMSPIGSWKASSIQNLYVKLRYTGSENQLVIDFLRNGQQEAGLDPSHPNENNARFPNNSRNYSQSFTINNLIKDGNYHTYVINNCDTNPEWKDVIQKFSLRYNDTGGLIPAESMDLLYFGVNNPGN